HTFHECKGKLGFEDPQNRTEHAVERTAPMALWAYTLVVLWYVQTGQWSRYAHRPADPWYTHKTAPAFSDMLATLRRASWAERLDLPCSSTTHLRKRIGCSSRFADRKQSEIDHLADPVERVGLLAAEVQLSKPTTTA